jgi:large subunit ribosomal protein L1
MNKEELKKIIEELKKSQKRNFKQTYDLIVNLKGLDLKKPENQVDFFHTLHFLRGKKTKICALIGPELKANAKENCDVVIEVDEFPKYAKEKKALKKVANECDWFIAQATVMPKVAASFGKVLGPKGKMPNPKAGCVVPPNANLKPLVSKLQKTVRLAAKTVPMVQVAVGKEDMPDEEVIDNIMTIYDALVHHLPDGRNNVKGVLLKLTMTKPIKLEK